MQEGRRGLCSTCVSSPGTGRPAEGCRHEGCKEQPGTTLRSRVLWRAASPGHRRQRGASQQGERGLCSPFSQGLSLQAEEVLLPVPLLQENRPPVTRRRDTAVPTPLGTCHQGDDAVGTSPPLQEAKAERPSEPCARMHLGGSVFQGEAPGPGSFGFYSGAPLQDPARREVRTTLKSRWSLVYCHMLPRRLAAALEDFSLSELEQREAAMSFWVPPGTGWCPPAHGYHPRRAKDLGERGRRLQAGAHRDELGGCSNGQPHHGVSRGGCKGLEAGLEAALCCSGDSQHQGKGREAGL